MATAVSAVAGLLTSPKFWAAAGFRNRNEFEWFLGKHLELLSLRQRIGLTWFWPESAVNRVKKLRGDK